MFKETREAGWFVIILAPIGIMALSLLSFEVLLPYARELGQYSSGLIQPTLSFNLVHLLVIVGGVLLWLGKQRPQDVGINRATLPTGLAITAACWLLTNLVLMASAIIGGGQLVLDSAWVSRPFTVIVGILIGQFLGNALVEEIVFRGFLFPQFYFKFGGSRKAWSRRPLILALVVSQVIFSLIHLPHRLFNELAGADLLVNSIIPLFLGLVFVAVYLRTRNLYIAIGVHALMNYPTPVVASPIDPQVVMFFLIVLLLIFWPAMMKRRLVSISKEPPDESPYGP